MPDRGCIPYKAVFLTDGETDWYGDNYAVENAFWSELGISSVAFGCSTEEEVLKAARDADAIISISVRVPISEWVIRSLDRCRCIVRAGVGYDNIDLTAATDKKIVVNNVPDYCTADVADHTVAMILTLVRRLPFLDRFVRGGGWQYSVQFTGPVPRLKTLTLGLVGYGRIARGVAARTMPLVSRVLTYDPFVDSTEAARLGVQMVSLETLLVESDIVSLHLPLHASTRHLIGKEQLAQTKRGALLVNTSRGALVDEEALAVALKEGGLAAAALDVLEKEPLSADNPLATLENVLFTPHFAGYSESAKTDLRQSVAKSVLAVLSGEWPKNVLNIDVAKHLTLKEPSQERTP